MSHPSLHDDDEGPMLKPRAKRTFDLSSSTQSSNPSTPQIDPISTSQLSPPSNAADEGASPSRTRSILNLTSSTLFGIYQPTGYAADREELSTPWGTGAETPAGSPNGSFYLDKTTIPASAFAKGSNGLHKRRRSTAAHMHRPPPPKGFKGYFLPLIARLTTMSVVGVLYGLLIQHLHDRRGLAPVPVNDIHRSEWPYMAVWGGIGALLGEALPWLDRFWNASRADDDEDAVDDTDGSQKPVSSKEGWNSIVRSVGAFVGIAFAIRKLPWQSTLQLSLTLALANPAVWYTVDRTPPGFVLATAVALGGTAVLFFINPALVPSPKIVSHDELVLGMFSQESVAVATWIASVLFVSTVCFGNIGRRLK